MLDRVLERIAYVEDDPDIQEVARVALEVIGGLQVTLYDSGARFLAEVEALDPQLVLLDVMLPSMTGPEILARLRTSGAAADIPVIFMTAKVQGQERQQYLDLGAVAVISKPFDPIELAEEIRHFWHEARS